MENKNEVSEKLFEVEQQLQAINKTLFSINGNLLFKEDDSYNNHQYDYLISALVITRESVSTLKKSISNIRMIYNKLNS